ncbi:MAG: excinuclease ABC subunit UvrC [Gammaproteobacteria bacterium]|nr:excinuclease ABC subunit UvrC [Gammaproteobacteria bacterium]
MMHLRQVLKTLPSQPGVYKMLDAQGDVLYVGKALNLKKRVTSYFSRSAQTAKTKALVEQIANIDVTITHSETEALILENAWIKLFHPKYNILMRDDKTYPFIHISEHPLYPNIAVVRRKKRPNSANYFGPYPSTTAVHQTIHLIHKVFKIRNCSDVYFNARTRPCLQYQIKRCSAPCTHFISAQDYQRAIEDTKRFLQGKSRQILQDLTTRMQAAVDGLAFEEAALLRDQIKHLRTVQEGQSMVHATGEADVIVLEAYPGFACVQWVQVRGGEVVASDHYFPKVPADSFDDDHEAALWQQVFGSFLTQIYVDTPERIPKTIITDRDVKEQAVLQTALTSLRGKSCQIKVGKRGLPQRWVSFAQKNLQQAMSKYHHAKESMQARLQGLATWMKLPHPITQIDCFDVSHFQGDATVASCVVFDEQGPAKRQYRRFNIQGVTRNDDYAAMAQALTRRYQNPEQRYPEVLIVDGGLGQVGIARRVLADLGIDSIAVLGVAKGRTRKSGWETFILAHQDEQGLPEHAPLRHLIQYIRDEAHRFAITAHRKKRDKSSMSSSLDSIEGIGPKRRKALLQRFGGIRALRHASIEELIKVPGISRDLASKIHQHFTSM